MMYVSEHLINSGMVRQQSNMKLGIKGVFNTPTLFFILFGVPT